MFRLTVALGAALAAAVIVVSLPLAASGPEEGFEWQMISRDAANTRPSST